MTEIKRDRIHSILVPPDWPERSPTRLAFVGEAPGEDEVLKRPAPRPLVGPSGGVFDAILRSAKIERSECLVTNVFSFKLENNQMADEKAIRRESWEPYWESQLDRLAQELAGVSPSVVVPLGGTALLALLGTSKITAYRGHPVMGTGRFSAFKLFPTVHPAFVLRDWKWYVPAIADVIKASREADRGPGAPITLPPRRLNIRPTIEEVEDFADRCITANRLTSADIETGWGLIRGVSLAFTEEEGLYVPFISKREPDRNYWQDPAHEVRAWRAFKRVMESPVPKLGQNFDSYDTIWLLAKVGIRPINFGDDLRVLHKALYPELPASLEFMANSYSSQTAWKAWADHGGQKKARSAKRDD